MNKLKKIFINKIYYNLKKEFISKNIIKYIIFYTIKFYK